MSAHIKSILIAACILTLSLGTQPIEAKEPPSKHLGSLFLSEIALDQYEKGDHESAMHEASKALMLDPENAQAQEILHNLGIERPLYKNVNTYSRQVTDLGKHVQVYRQLIEELEAEKMAMEERLNALLSERNYLHEENVAKKGHIQELQGQIQSLEHDRVSQKRYYDQQINDVEKYYRTEQAQLKEDLFMLESQNYERGINRHMENELGGFSSDRMQHLIHIADNYENQLTQLSTDYNDLRQQLFEMQSREDTMLQLMEDYVYIRSNEIETLEDDLVYKQVDLTKSQYQLLSKLDEMVNLREAHERNRQQMKEMDQMIDDKNGEIKILQQKVDSQ